MNRKERKKKRKANISKICLKTKKILKSYILIILNNFILTSDEKGKRWEEKRNNRHREREIEGETKREKLIGIERVMQNKL